MTMNSALVIPYMKKITDAKIEGSFTPYFTWEMFTFIYIFGVFSFLFVKRIKRKRHILALEKKVEILNVANFRGDCDEELIEIKRRLKLYRLKKKTKKIKICGMQF